jgi:glycosyltransferase involved in cell wall biosynthesis
MAAGIPVIASNFILWEKIIKDNRCGILVDPLNPKEIAGAIEYLITSENDAESLGHNGSLMAEKKYNWKHEKIKLIEFYNKLLI